MRPRPVCGSNGGYYRHYAAREVTCRPCCDAHAAYKARLKRRARILVTPPVNDPLYRAARLGREPAEALTTADRARLVAELHRLGWSDVEIAAHTRMSTYTAARIRGRLDLPANPTHPANRRTA